jgi:hypothetical protein
MKLNELLAKHPLIKIAGPRENDAILEFFSSLSMEGKKMEISYERDPDFFHFLGLGGPCFFVFIIKSKSGEISGLGTIVLRPGQIKGKKEWVGYLGDLRIKPDRKTSVLWRNFYGDLIRYSADIDEFGGCQYFYTSILKENKKATNALVLNKKNSFQYFHLIDYKMVNIFIRFSFWESLKSNSFFISQGKVEDKGEIVKFLANQNKNKAFGHCFEESYDELNFRIENWKPFYWDNFIIVKNLKGKIVGLTFLWSPSPFKKIILRKIPPFFKLYFTFQNLFKKSPKEGGEFKVQYLNFLSFELSLNKKEKEAIFKKMVNFIYHLPSSKKFHALSFCSFKGNVTEKLKGYITQETSLSLYTVTVRPMNEKKTLTLGELPPGFEMSLV